jgi:phage-related protein (TIGR01555 family)
MQWLPCASGRRGSVAEIQVLNDEQRLDGVLANLVTGMSTSRDRFTHTTIAPTEFLSEGQLDSLYIGSWLCRKVVDIFPSEATRAGWDIGLGDDSKAKRSKSDALVAAGERLRLRRHIRDGLRLARLTGGAAVILLVDDGTDNQEGLAKEIDWKRLRSIKGLYALDRWRIWPDPSWGGVGMPELYQFNSSRDAELARRGIDTLQTLTIHSSRVLRFEGLPLPWRWRQHHNWWGMSVLQSLWDVFKRFETGQQSAAQILHDFDVYCHKMPGLAKMISAGEEDLIRNRVHLMAEMRSTMRTIVLSGEEEGQFMTRSAAGISDVLDRLKEEVTGATSIPHTKLWGESPSGLGATGRSEDRSFAQDVAQYQEDFAEEPLRQFYSTLMRCSQGPWKGAEPPEDWQIVFRPTFVRTEEETADLYSKTASADSQWINSQVLRPNEVALGRFGRPQFSLDTTLIDREADGSIPVEDQEEPISFGGDMALPADENGQPFNPNETGKVAINRQRAAMDSADGEPCCEACGRGEECESDCPENGDCEAEHEDDAEGKDDPSTHVHPDKVGQVMHRWKHGTLHSGTGRKGEHRGQVPHGKAHMKQAIAIALSIAGKDRPRRRGGEGRKVRTDAARLPGRVRVAGLTVDCRQDGTGTLVGPYGPTPVEVVVGTEDSGWWRVMDGSTGEYCMVAGVSDEEAIRAAAGHGGHRRVFIRHLDSIDLAAMGIRVDAYDDE